MDEDFWRRQAKSIVRAELMRRGMSQERLVGALAEIGVEETVSNLRTKLSRGSFTAVYFLQLLTAMGVERVQLPGGPGTPTGDEAAGPMGAQAVARGFRPTTPRLTRRRARSGVKDPSQADGD